MSIITVVRCEGCFLLERCSCMGYVEREKFKGIINKTYKVDSLLLAKRHWYL